MARLRRAAMEAAWPPFEALNQISNDAAHRHDNQRTWHERRGLTEHEWREDRGRPPDHRMLRVSPGDPVVGTQRFARSGTFVNVLRKLTEERAPTMEAAKVNVPVLFGGHGDGQNTHGVGGRSGVCSP